MSKVNWCPEMADPLRPASQRTLRPLSDEEAARIYAGVRANTHTDLAARLAAFGALMNVREVAHQRQMQARRRLIAERVGTVIGVVVVGVVLLAALMLAGAVWTAVWG